MINLLFAGNYKVFDGIMINLISLVKHTSCPINVFILTMDLSDYKKEFIPINNTHIECLTKILTEKNKLSTIKLYDLTKEFKNEMLTDAIINSEFTPYSLLRLFIDKIDNVPDKLLYLDTDTIINNNLEELYKIDIDNYELAAVRDLFIWAYPQRWKCDILKGGYFNAGVLLLNLKKIKETKLFEKARYMTSYKKMHYMDQDALNRCVTYKKMLPLKFNSKDKYYKEIVVHHFCNVRKDSNWLYRIKPWEVDLVKSKMDAYNDILDEYLLRINEFKNRT